MKRNPIFIFSMLCMLALGSCGKGESGNAEPIDTATVVKDFLVSRGVLEEEDFRIAADANVQANNATPAGKVTAGQLVEALRGPEWVSKSGLVSVRDAKDQVNTYLDLTFRNRLRSFTIEREVFEHYLKNSPDTLGTFKFCIGVARNAAGDLEKRQRSLFVVGVSKNGHLISIKQGNEYYYYDQISPCPSVCPKVEPGLSYCDYMDVDAVLGAGERCVYGEN